MLNPRINVAVAVLAVTGLTLSAPAATTIYGGLLLPTGTGPAGTGTTGSGETEAFPSSSPTAGSETVGTGVGVGTVTYVSGNAVQYTEGQRFTTTKNGVTTDVLNGLIAGQYTTANATDAGGNAVGYYFVTPNSSNTSTSNRRAAYWAAGSTTPVTLSLLNGSAAITSTTTSADQAFYITTSQSNGNATRIYGTASLYGGTNNSAYLGTRAAAWDASGNASQLGVFYAPGSTTYLSTTNGTSTGTTNARALSANTADTAVGYAFLYSSGGVALGNRATRWAADGTATLLGDVINNSTVSTTQNPTATAALSINAKGDAVGFGPTFDAAGNNLGNRAIVWKAGTTTAVALAVPATYTATVAGTAQDYAFKINNSGEAVGTTTKASSFPSYATRWDTSTGAATLLGSPTAFTASSSDAFDVNDAGVVAGDIRDATTGSYHAVIWGTDDQPIDLNTLLSTADASVWSLQKTYSITNDGWVSGYGQYTPDAGTTYTRDFLIQLPANLVPEPTALALAGFSGAALLRRRSRRTNGNGYVSTPAHR